MKETRFQQTEIGLIPEDWKVVPIEELFEIGNGYTPSKAIPEYWNHGTLPWFRMEDIRLNGRILKDSIQHITPLAVKGSGLFPANSIIISTTATIGEHALLIADSLANQRFTFLWNVNRCYSVDMYYVFYHCFLLGEWCRNNINFGGLTAVNMNAFKKYPFPLPPISEQRKIAESLGDMDALIAGLDKLIAKKRLIKQGTMQQLLTGRTRLKGFNEPWKELSISDTFDFIPNNTYSREQMADEGKVRNIHYGDILIKYSNVLDLSKVQLPAINNLTETNRPLKNGDIVIADTAEDDTVGKAVEVINIGDYKVEAGLHTIALRPRLEFAKGFLGFYINSTAFHNQILPHIQGIKVSSISKKAVSTLVLHVPSEINEQRAIASILTDMDDDLSELKKKKAKYEKLKQGMMQQLLTGRIRLI